MNNLDFDDPDLDDDEFNESDDSQEFTAALVPPKSNQTPSIQAFEPGPEVLPFSHQDRFYKTLTTRRTDPQNFSKIRLNNGCQIDKHSLNDYLQTLYDSLLSVRKKKNSPTTGGAAAAAAADLDDEDSLDDDDNQEKTKTNQQRSGSQPLSVTKSKKNEPISAAERKRLAAQDRDWKRRQEAVLREIEDSLMEKFQTSEDPFMLNLILIENSRDYGVNKYNTLSCVIAKSFEKWLSHPSAHLQSQEITQDLKIEAFLVASKYNIMVVDYVAKPYELINNNHALLPYLKSRLQTLDNKDRAILISSLMMQEFFDCEEILIPLLLEDKLNILEKYLAKSVEQQKNFIRLLDSMCSKDFHMFQYLDRYRVKKPKTENLSQRYLSKLERRLINTYKLDGSLCPNANKQQYMKNLRFLVRQRYIEGAIDVEPWRELIDVCIKQGSQHTVQTFFDMLADNDDIPEIAFWVHRLNFDPKILPIYVQQMLTDYQMEQAAGGPSQLNSSKAKSESDRFYQLKLDESRIHMVDNEKLLGKFLDDLEAMIDYSLEGPLYVGVDSEWKPTCVSGVSGEHSNKAALIQVATQTDVYLIDTVNLKLNESQSRVFSKRFFTNKRIIKIGYGFSHDIRVILHSIGCPADADAFRHTVLDLAYLVNQLLRQNSQLFATAVNDNSTKDSTKEKGLSQLVRWCFGKSLNKSEQISNWERRPLRKSQITYAALDAFCLLEIFQFIRARMSALGIDFDVQKATGRKLKASSSMVPSTSVNSDLNMNEKSTDKGSKEQILADMDSLQINPSPISAQDLRVVCDNMLTGLGKELRRCGIDTIIIDNDKDHCEVARIARRENRYALSSGLPYFAVRSQLPEGRCINVVNTNPKDQCVQVLRVFNVKIKMKDLFSRCNHCNCRSFIKLTKHQVKTLWSKVKADTAGVLDEQAENELSLDADLAQKVDVESMRLRTEQAPKLNIQCLFESTIDIIDMYYICAGCGHMYWDGPHWQNMNTRFSHVLSPEEAQNASKSMLSSEKLILDNND